jgi:MotA/TolQ/ExbB proton channel family
MRRGLIQFLFPTLFCLTPALAGILIALAIPIDAKRFYLDHLSPIDFLILSLGLTLFLMQSILAWRALGWRGPAFEEWPDRWLTSLAQAAEWFPLLGLLGTVAGILQTFSSIDGPVEPARVIALYAPAITATGSGLFMALVNILPTWMVLFGREVLLTFAGDAPTPGETRP